jgi:hypothetical protein
MKTLFALLVGCLALVLRVSASERFPSVEDLESALHLRAGVMLPREVVVEGRVYSVLYLRGRSLHDGTYDVMLQLVPLPMEGKR